MLRQVTRRIATTESLPQVLRSVVEALAAQPGIITARIWLLQDDAECDTCRAGLPTQFMLPTPGGEVAHLQASAGIPAFAFFDAPLHRMPIEAPLGPARVIRTREAFRQTDMLADEGMKDPRFGAVLQAHPEVGAILKEVNPQGAAAYPLIFHGEVLGAIGMIANRQIADDEYHLLGIFADQVAIAIKNAFLFRELGRYRDRLEVENAYLQEEILHERGFEGIVGESPALQAVLRKVRQVAGVETTVLLTGETGTGKELIARALHEGSLRKERPMIKVNCGAIPQGVVESELFGHEKGAFTGALQRRIGRFELAHNGTLFMDEVGELPLDTQVKLLRVLQEREFERVGSTRPQQVDVRLVAATNRDLGHEVASGRFRADLFYRLNVFPIHIPPLRERAADIPLLVRHFLTQFQRKLAKPLKAVTAQSMERLQAYPWPGNIRELQNVLERACVLSSGPTVSVDDLVAPRAVAPAATAGEPDPGPIVTLAENERLHIRRALTMASGKVHGPGGAAAILGINPSTLRSRMEKLGIGKA